jgi:hypothetical protein
MVTPRDLCCSLHVRSTLISQTLAEFLGGTERGIRSSGNSTTRLDNAQGWQGLQRAAWSVALLHADLTILAKLSCALARARAVSLAA